jgi:hypothetical protein
LKYFDRIRIKYDLDKFREDKILKIEETPKKISKEMMDKMIELTHRSFMILLFLHLKLRNKANILVFLGLRIDL